MTLEEKKEFVRKVQNNTQPKKINVTSMFKQQKKIIEENKEKIEKERFNNKMPEEVSPIGIIHAKRKTMKVERCRDKHNRLIKEEEEVKKRVSKTKIVIVKKKDQS